MLQNEYFMANIDFETARNEPSKVLFQEPYTLHLTLYRRKEKKTLPLSRFLIQSPDGVSLAVISAVCFAARFGILRSTRV